MYETLRIVLDTNVLISAIVGHGKPRQLVVRLLSGQRHQIVSSHQMLAELADVLSREKFRDVDKSQVSSFLSILGSKATTTLITVNQVKEVIKEDPDDDDMILATAIEGNATYIVSGDEHLLKLRRFKEIRIVSTKEMLELLSSSNA